MLWLHHHSNYRYKLTVLVQSITSDTIPSPSEHYVTFECSLTSEFPFFIEFFFGNMQSEAELVLNLFLKFGIFEARCPYKIVLIKKNVYWEVGSLLSFFNSSSPKFCLYLFFFLSSCPYVFLISVLFFLSSRVSLISCQLNFFPSKHFYMLLKETLFR